MTESRPVQLPPPVAGQTRPTAEPPNAQITSLPPGLDDVREITKLMGEVIQVKADNTVRILTQQGEVDVRLDPRATPPAEGQTVEVDIPPGNPPRTARVTVEDAATNPRPAPPETQSPPPPRTAQTPVEILVRPPPETPPPANAPRGSVPEAPVRLEPIEPEQVPALINEPLETILSSAQQLTEIKTEIIVQKTQENVASQVSNIVHVPVKPAQSFQPLIPAPGQKPPQSPPLFSDIKSTPSLPEPSVFFTKPPVPGIAGAETEHSPLAQNLALFLPSLAADGKHIGAKELIPEPFQIQIFTSDITKPTALTTIPQIFHARITAVGLPQAQFFDASDKITPKLKAFMAAATDEPLILKNQKAETAIATLIGHTAQKLPIIGFLSTPESFGKGPFFILHAPLPELVPGSTMTLLPHPLPHESAAAASLAPFMLQAMAPVFSALEPWPLMDEIYQALNQVLPQAAQAFTNMLPSPAKPEQLGPAALLFIAAANGGDVSGWLGDRAADVIRRAGRAGLISRLGAESAPANRLSAGPVSQDWRGMSLPLYWDNQIHKLAFYFRQDSQSGKDSKEGGKQVRFIFDLALDNMGKVQLDGLFRARRLDLIVRSEQAFSNPMQMKMRQAYIAALEPTEVKGELSFQNKPEQWVTINPERKGFGASI